MIKFAKLNKEDHAHRRFLIRKQGMNPKDAMIYVEQRALDRERQKRGRK